MKDEAFSTPVKVRLSVRIKIASAQEAAREAFTTLADAAGILIERGGE
jgi:hypothetical protein